MSPNPSGAPDALLASVEAAIAREDRSWRRIRSWPTAARFGLCLGLIAILELAVLIAAPRLDLEAYPRVRLGLAIAVLVLAAAAGVRLFVHPQHARRLSRSVVLPAALALLALPLAITLLPAAHGAVHLHPESFAGTGADFLPRALACLIFGTLVATPVMTLLLMLDRRRDADPVRIVIAAGTGGVAATLALILHCPIVAMSHGVVGHAAVGLVSGLLLAAVVAVSRRRTLSRNSEN